MINSKLNLSYQEQSDQENLKEIYDGIDQERDLLINQLKEVQKNLDHTRFVLQSLKHFLLG